MQNCFIKQDIITLIYCDFGVLSTNTRSELLQKIHQALLPQGVLLFDVFTKQKYQDLKEHTDWAYHEKGFWNEKPHVELHRFYRYEMDCTFLHQHILLTEDTLSYYNIWEHTFTFDELKKDLTLAGFQRVEFYGNVVGEPCAIDDPTFCVMAYK